MTERFDYLKTYALQHTIVSDGASTYCNAYKGTFFYGNQCRDCGTPVIYAAATDTLYTGDADPLPALCDGSNLKFIGYILDNGSLLPPLQTS